MGTLQALAASRRRSSTGVGVHQLLVAPLTANYARQAARLHIEGQPGTFLTSLGEDVLTVFYRALPQSPVDLALPSTDRSRPAPAARTAAGFISATTSVGSLFVEMASQRLGELLLPLLRRYVQAPPWQCAACRQPSIRFWRMKRKVSRPPNCCRSWSSLRCALTASARCWWRRFSRMPQPLAERRDSDRRRRQRWGAEVLPAPRLFDVARYHALWPPMHVFRRELA